MPPKFVKLLLEVLHCDPALPGVEMLTQLTSNDWDRFISEAIEYRVAFQVNEYLHADPLRLQFVPQACLSRLADSINLTVVGNLRQQANLNKLLSACQVIDLPVILMKGLWLVETVYRDIRGRSSSDVDLLFRPEDMPRFTQLAKELGFDIPESVADIRDLMPAKNEFSLIHSLNGSPFLIHWDVHWALTHPLKDKPIDEEKLWQRSEIVTIAGMRCRSLCVEDHFLFLCFHAAIHHRFNYVGPRALLDIARLIALPPRPIDWGDLVARAHELGWDRGTWLMLDLVREHFGLQPPRIVLDSLQSTDEESSHIKIAAMDAVFLSQNHHNKISKNIIRLLSDSSIRNRARIVMNGIFPPKEVVATQFHTPIDSPWFFLLYLRRWGKVKKYFPSITGIFKGEDSRRNELERGRVIDSWINKG